MNNIPTEDKQKICDLLCETLKATRNHHDIVALRYEIHDNGNELVTVVWESGSQKVNVSMDSGTALIRDIMRVCD